METMFEKPESTKLYVVRHRRLLLLLVLFIVGSFYVFVVDGRVFTLFKNTINSAPTEVGEEVQQTEGQSAEEIAMIEFKRQSIPPKYSFSEATSVNMDDGDAPISVEEWRAANPAIVAAQENRAPITEAVISGEIVTSDDSEPVAEDDQQSTGGHNGTGSVTGTVTLAAPVKVGDPFAVGTPDSVTISGVVYSIDQGQSIIALDSEDGDFNSLSVNASGAQVVIGGSTFGLQALEDGDIIEVVGTQYPGSHTVTATKITVTGALQLVPLPEDPSVSES